MTKMAATRDGYGEALLELADNPKAVSYTHLTLPTMDSV